MIFCTLDSNSFCLFTSVNTPLLQPGQMVTVAISPAQIPANTQATVALAGADRAVDSNGVENAQNGRIEAIVTTPAQLGLQDRTVDFGFVPLLRIGDFVWRDLDGNGLQNENVAASALVGVRVDLRNAAGVVVASQLTDASGNYEFSSRTVSALLPDTRLWFHSGDVHWRPRVERRQRRRPAGRVRARHQRGACDALPAAGQRPDAARAAVQRDDRCCWQVPVLLEHVRGAGAVVDAVRSGDAPCADAGPSVHADRRAGRHARDALDSDAVRRGDECVAQISVPRIGFTTVDLDIGLVRELLIGDRLFIDKDSDGLVDRSGSLVETEPPVRGATVQLLRNNVVVETTVTDANGKYLFGKGAQPLLANSDYKIQIDMNPRRRSPTSSRPS